MLPQPPRSLDARAGGEFDQAVDDPDEAAVGRFKSLTKRLLRVDPAELKEAMKAFDQRKST